MPAVPRFDGSFKGDFRSVPSVRIAQNTSGMMLGQGLQDIGRSLVGLSNSISQRIEQKNNYLAQGVGAAEGMSEDFDPNGLPVNGSRAAMIRHSAALTSFATKTNTAISEKLALLKMEHQNDPTGYKIAAQNYLDASTQGMPPQVTASLQNIAGSQVTADFVGLKKAEMARIEADNKATYKYGQVNLYTKMEKNDLATDADNDQYMTDQSVYLETLSQAIQNNTISQAEYDYEFDKFERFNKNKLLGKEVGLLYRTEGSQAVLEKIKNLKEAGAVDEATTAYGYYTALENIKTNDIGKLTQLNAAITARIQSGGDPSALIDQLVEATAGDPDRHQAALSMKTENDKIREIEASGDPVYMRQQADELRAQAETTDDLLQSSALDRAATRLNSSANVLDQAKRSGGVMNYAEEAGWLRGRTTGLLDINDMDSFKSTLNQRRSNLAYLQDTGKVIGNTNIFKAEEVTAMNAIFKDKETPLAQKMQIMNQLKNLLSDKEMKQFIGSDPEKGELGTALSLSPSLQMDYIKGSSLQGINAPSSGDQEDFFNDFFDGLNMPAEEQGRLKKYITSIYNQRFIDKHGTLNIEDDKALRKELRDEMFGEPLAVGAFTILPFTKMGGGRVTQEEIDETLAKATTAQIMAASPQKTLPFAVDPLTGATTLDKRKDGNTSFAGLTKVREFVPVRAGVYKFKDGSGRFSTNQNGAKHWEINLPKLVDMVQNGVDPSKPPSKVEAGFASPASGGKLSDRRFGQYKHPIKKIVTAHNGVDIQTTGPAYAVTDGEVFVKKNNGGAGNTVELHATVGGKKHVFKYFHLQANGLPKAGKLKKGDQIGLIGSTGQSTGPHLHFEHWVDGKAINPMDVVGSFYN
jgi:murein DD-endopeptidase MepM/ murein hydrolase activator NlpD